MSEIKPLGGAERIAVRAEMWTRDGEWMLLVWAPEWVVDDFARRWRRVGRSLWLHNHGGGMGSYSFLLGTREAPKVRRVSRLKNWIGLS